MVYLLDALATIELREGLPNFVKSQDDKHSLSVFILSYLIIFYDLCLHMHTQLFDCICMVLCQHKETKLSVLVKRRDF